jgi:hypothetical protein
MACVVHQPNGLRSPPAEWPAYSISMAPAWPFAVWPSGSARPGSAGRLRASECCIASECSCFAGGGRARGIWLHIPLALSCVTPTVYWRYWRAGPGGHGGAQGARGGGARVLRGTPQRGASPRGALRLAPRARYGRYGVIRPPSDASPATAATVSSVPQAMPPLLRQLRCVPYRGQWCGGFRAGCTGRRPTGRRP